MLLKVKTVENVLSATFSILIIGSNFKNVFLTIVMICCICVLILAILLLSVLKLLIIAVLFMTLANQVQFICGKIAIGLSLGLKQSMSFCKVSTQEECYTDFRDQEQILRTATVKRIFGKKFKENNALTRSVLLLMFIVI